MGTYSGQEDKFFQKRISLILPIVGSGVRSFERIAKGRNSRIYLVRCNDSKKYACKFYFSNELDFRDRMGVEFSALRFLWNNGIRNVPEPIFIHNEQRFAIYEYIDGAKVGSQGITERDIDYASDFLKRINALRQKAVGISPASEAFFSVGDVVGNLEKRYNRLAEISEDVGLSGFLEEEFLPLFNSVVRWCRSELEFFGSELEYGSFIKKRRMVLSPSDFGFHNALRKGDGSIVFLDFEHFGWDDPAKTISDFLLHPEMNLSSGLKEHFVRNVLSCFPEDSSLEARLRIVFPLFGLKWCLIILNEFLAEHFLRRQFAYGEPLVAEEVQAEQLVKARVLLDEVSLVYKNFPYGL
ncbi:hypothetical protein J4470_00070 [Candidatus Woesearchaeota archaeon]|nr:hypothetical protein [Candidatus Woesearchaeota archaeon]